TATGTVGVSGSGSTRTVTISGITGNGTLGISIAAGTASDTAGNLAPAAGPSGIFTVDNTAPAVSINRHNPGTVETSARALIYRVTFSEAVTGVDTADFVLNKTGSADGSIASV